MSHTFVLVHGAWHGGWSWRRVADRLRVAGHSVFSPTCTGLGERAHLLSPQIGLSTCIDDVTSVLECEELTDVVLVGHSFGGVVITGVADRMPQRLRHLVFLDAVILESGESVFDRLPTALAAQRRAAAVEVDGALCFRVPPPEAFGITDAADLDWLRRRLTPQPLKSYSEPLQLTRSPDNGIARTYLSCIEPVYAPIDDSRQRAAAYGWGWRDIHAGHDAMISAPDAVVAALLETVSAG